MTLTKQERAIYLSLERLIKAAITIQIEGNRLIDAVGSEELRKLVSDLGEKAK